MQAWQSSFLGNRQLSKDLGAFELQAFSRFPAPTWISFTRGAQTRASAMYYRCNPRVWLFRLISPVYLLSTG